MANVNTNAKYFTIQTGDTFYLGNPGLDDCTGTTAIHFVSSAFVGTITVKALSMRKEAMDNSVAPVPWAYVGYWTNGAAANGIQTVGITTTSLIWVPASGLRIVLDAQGAYTSGAMACYVSQVEGAAV